MIKATGTTTFTSTREITSGSSCKENVRTRLQLGIVVRCISNRLVRISFSSVMISWSILMTLTIAKFKGKKRLGRQAQNVIQRKSKLGVRLRKRFKLSGERDSC